MAKSNPFKIIKSITKLVKTVSNNKIKKDQFNEEMQFKKDKFDAEMQLKERQLAQKKKELEYKQFFHQTNMEIKYAQLNEKQRHNQELEKINAIKNEQLIEKLELEKATSQISEDKKRKTVQYFHETKEDQEENKEANSENVLNRNKQES